MKWNLLTRLKNFLTLKIERKIKMAVQTTTPINKQTTTTTTSLDEQAPTVSPLEDELLQKREQLTQAQITQTNAYGEFNKVMKAKLIVDPKDTETVAKLEKLMFENFITYQNALEDAQKLQVELSDLESQRYLEDLLG